MLLSEEDILKKSLSKKASLSAPLLLLLRVLQRATFALWNHRTQKSLLLPLQTSSAQRMRVDASLLWHARPHSHKEWESSWHGRDKRRRFTGAPRAGAVLPGRESSSGASRDEQKQGHPVHQDEYFQIRSFAASERVRSRSQISARGGWSQEPSRSDACSPHRTGAASPERGPPKTRQPGSDQTGRGKQI